ncbi:hypothetical protein LRS05_02215 [Flavobacterium sp. J372]|uniref:hypothetical protein n=1 Tax=Flavobacterium sp. J372 TaxID=2898436 RepID=UPI002150FEE7|nr:hypothetical protein [Flavobacterium sp. J372]MCR5861030.1 hypothetical protein [Flavobacterium sp. J372]
MKYISIIIAVTFAATLFSCEEDDKQRRIDTIRAEKHNDSILKIISNNWSFEVAPPTPAVQQRIMTWSEWNQLMTELEQKPKGGINAYKQKTKNLVDKADRVRQNLPSMFAKPQVYSRLGVLVTKIKDLYTYLNVDVIQDKKVLKLIADTRQEITSVQNQLDEIIRISQIPKEQGEEEMLRALDTTRMANPDRMMQPEQVTPAPGMAMPDRNRTFTKP